MDTPAIDHVDASVNQPVYWFLILELAVESGDHIAAAEAQRELSRLGIEIRYGRKVVPDARR